jgi:hypothetical protein
MLCAPNALGHPTLLSYYFAWAIMSLLLFAQSRTRALQCADWYSKIIVVLSLLFLPRKASWSAQNSGALFWFHFLMMHDFLPQQQHYIRFISHQSRKAIIHSLIRTSNDHQFLTVLLENHKILVLGVTFTISCV